MSKTYCNQLFLFYSLCINEFCFHTCFSTQMILTLNVYPKSKPEEARLMDGVIGFV